MNEYYLSPQPGPAPAPTPGPALQSEPRVATHEEYLTMEEAQEFIAGPTNVMAESLWNRLRLFPLGDYKEKGLDIINLLLSQKVIWIAEDDEKVCAYCEGNVEQGFVLSSLPSTHPNCRCGLTLTHPGLIDVTEPVMKALRNTCNSALRDTFDYQWLISQVDNWNPWDIKRNYDIDHPADTTILPWEETLGIPYPGSHDEEVVFRDEVVTPEWLGNFTFGYIAAAMGMGGVIAKGGSVFVALRDFIGSDFVGGNILELIGDFMSKFLSETINELGDHLPIDAGNKAFGDDLKSGVYNDVFINMLNDFTNCMINQSDSNYMDDPRDTGVFYA